MRAALIALSDALHAATRLVGLVMLLVLVGAVSLQVVARYGFSAPPVWTEEAARYAMIWVGLMGAAMSFKARFDPALFTPKTGPRGQFGWQAGRSSGNLAGSCLVATGRVIMGTPRVGRRTA